MDGIDPGGIVRILQLARRFVRLCAIALQALRPNALCSACLAVIVIAAPAHAQGYRIGPNDVLKVTVYRSIDFDTTTAVSADGTIQFPRLGTVKVAGQTSAQVAATLAAGLKQAGVLLDPTVTVLVMEYRSRVVSVLGAVERPGEFPIDRDTLTIAQALARAGANFGTVGGTVSILGDDPAKPRETIPIAALVSGQRDRPVRAGEVLFVQAAATFYVSGEVQKPGAYPIEPGMTVGQAIALAGGFTPRGTAGKIKVSRKQGDVTGAPQRVKFEDAVVPGDLVVVGARIF